MISVTQLRNGVFFLFRNTPHQIVDYKHKHMGRGGGTIRVKAKNLHTGGQIEQTFRSGEKVEEIDVSKKQVQFLYLDSDAITFIDPDNYEQILVSKRILGEQVNFLQEGMMVWLQIWEKDESEVLSVDLPATVVFTVAEADPGEKGNSATNIYKDGVLENGHKVRIPLFVNQGEKIRINTSDGSYVERA